MTVFLSVGFAASTMGQQTVTTESFQGREVGTNRIIVRFRTQNVVQSEALAAQDADISGVQAVGSTGAVVLRSRGRNVAQLLQDYQNRSDVLYAEPDYVVRAEEIPNDLYLGNQWALRNTGQSILGQSGTSGADIKATSAWDITEGSRSFVIGVVDSGVAYDHPDLAANMWSAPAGFSVVVAGQTITCAAGTHGFDAISRTCDPINSDEHGTHVAGILGASGNNGIGLSGVSRIASIMALKFISPSGSGLTSDAIAAMEFARKVKAHFGGAGGAADVRILNNSWGGTGLSQALKDEIILAGDSTNNMLVVAGAGNGGLDGIGDNNDTAPHYPSSFSTDVANVISVAATDFRDALGSFSNFGATSVNLGAPGVAIASTLPTITYTFRQGTSMATPMVSGVASLMLSGCPGNLTAPQLKTTLLSAGSLDAKAALAGKTTTGGRLNALKALQNCGAVAPASSFKLAATQGFKTVGPAGSVTSTISVSPVGSFSGSVDLSVTAPAGITATLTLSTISSSTPSTLTITAGGGLAPGTYLISVQGQSGGIAQVTGVSFTVVPPLNPGTAVNGTISSTTDQPDANFFGVFADVYRLANLNTTTNITASLESNDFNPFVYILSANGSVIAANFNSVSALLSANTTYFVKAVTGTTGDSGDYRLSINLPSLTSISPDFGGRGTSFPVTLTGALLNSGNLTINAGAGIAASVTSASATTATATFTISPAAAVGPRDITVTTTAGTSGPRTFTVVQGLPTLTNISPSSGGRGALLDVTLTGTNFTSGLTVDAGTSIVASNISVVSPTSATARFTIPIDAPIGAHNVTVTTAEGTSSPATFTVEPPVTLSGITPVSGLQGTNVSVTLTGTNFAAPFIVNAGSGITVSSINVTSSTSATATFGIAVSAALGTRNVTVTTPGGTSNAQTFSVFPPIPTLSGISPSTGIQGGTFFVFLTGTNFVAGLTINAGPDIIVSGIDVQSPTSVIATFSIPLTAALGDRTVRVSTSGGTSGSVTLTVQSPPAPTLSGVSPPSGGQGSTVNVTLLGTNFITGLTINPIPDITITNVVVEHTLKATATFAIAAESPLGTRDVSVNTAGGTSGTASFEILPPPPTLTGITPSSTAIGSSVSVTLTGTNFVAPLAVQGGSGIDVSNINVADPTTATATFTPSDNTFVGVRNVRVSTVGGTSGTVPFTVDPPPPPTLTGLNPGTGAQGTSVVITLTGTNFYNPHINISGTGVPLSDFSSDLTTITVTMNISPNAALGTRDLTVTTLGGTTSALSFTILPPVPGLTNIVPGVGARGAGVPLNVTLTGMHFVSGLTVDAGADITVSNVNVTSLTSATATFDIAAAATLGVRNVTVTTSGGTSSGAPFTVADPFPDLTVSSSHGGNFGVGFNETYTVTARNVGTAPSTGTITVSDTVPAGMTFVSAAGGGWSCSAAGQAVTCTNAVVLAVNAAASYALTVTIGSGAVGTVSHAVAVTTAGDLNTSNDSTTDATIVVGTPAPVFVFLPSSPPPGVQGSMNVTIPSAFPHDVTGSVTVTFASSAVIPLDDPNIQFATGGRTVPFTIPANSLQARFGTATQPGPVGFQAGTVAGKLTFAGTFTAGTVQGTFSPPASVGTIPLQAPVIRDVQTTSQGGFSASFLLFSTTREVTQLSITFNTSQKFQLSCGTVAGCSTSGNTLTLDVASLFTQWFTGDATFGGMTLLRLPLNIEGKLGGSVSVTFRNNQGVSNTASFQLP